MWFGGPISISGPQWRFYVMPGGTAPRILPRPPKFLIDSIVISLSRCCVPTDEGPRPPPLQKTNIFPRTATGGPELNYVYSVIAK